MAFSLRPRRRAEVPAEVLSRVDLLPKERLLAAAESRDPASWVLVGTARLYAVPHLGDIVARPWHMVDAGTWDHDNFTLTITWVDGFRPQQWVFRTRRRCSRPSANAFRRRSCSPKSSR